MHLFDSIILGIVEGLTEFLPVSSTFHLLVTGKLLGISQTSFTSLFEVVIQGAAIISVCILYWRDIVTNKHLTRCIAFSFVPTAIVGYVLHSFITQTLFQETFFSLIVFIVVGIIFVLMDYIPNQTHSTIEDMSFLTAICIGIVQACAVVPGVSRSGAVIVGMMCMGFSREEAARYSFILAVPTILAASGYDLLKMRHLLLANSSNWVLLLTGCVVALTIAIMSIRFFISYLKSHSLMVFGWYRIGAGIILLLFAKGFTG